MGQAATTPDTLGPLRRIRSGAGRLVREAVLYPRAAGRRNRPRVIFYPSGSREQASLLRAYDVADVLQQDFGWTTLVVPKHLTQRQRARVSRIFRPDIAVVQKCRHPLNRSEFFASQSFLLDVDDADFLDPMLAEPMARMAERSAGVICGSRFVRDWAASFAPRAEIVWTGTAVRGGPWASHTERRRLVSWAQAEPLRYEHDFRFVISVLVQVAARTAPFTLRLYGWSDGYDHPSLAPLRAAGIALDLKPSLPYNTFLDSLRQVAVGMSPLVGESGFNKGKSFGKILGYLDAKVPVVCSAAADHDLFFDETTGVVTNDPELWVDSIVSLLDSADLRRAMSEAAYSAFLTHLTNKVFAASVDRLLRAAIARGEVSTLIRCPGDPRTEAGLLSYRDGLGPTT